MNESFLVTALVHRLEKARYHRLPIPFRVASVAFEFAAALRGSGARALDLVIVIDTATGSESDRDGKSVRHRVEALSRALDVTSSRYTLSVILVGAALGDEVRALSETCRVLTVPSEALDATSGIELDKNPDLDDHIRVLLPLELPDEEQVSADGLPSTLVLLTKELPESPDSVLLQDLIRGSYRGEQGVRAALGKRIDDVLGELDAQ